MKNEEKKATKVAKTDDNVKQLVESIKGQRQLKEKEQQLRAARTNFRVRSLARFSMLMSTFS